MRTRRYYPYEARGPSGSEWMVVDSDGTEDGRTIARGIESEDDAELISDALNAREPEAGK